MATGPTTVNITWSPPVNGSNCIDHYIITINSNNQYTSTNTTSVIVSDLTGCYQWSLHCSNNRRQ